MDYLKACRQVTTKYTNIIYQMPSSCFQQYSCDVFIVCCADGRVKMSPRLRCQRFWEVLN